MATVAEVLDTAARACRVKAPTNWVSSTTDTSMEMKDVLAETVDELLERVDWPDPITLDVPITGTDVETYDLPDGFKRLTRDEFAVYETTRSRRPCIPVASNGAWSALQLHGSAGGDRYYRTSGNEDDGFQISFFRNLETGASITVSYVTKNWLSVSGTPGATWDNVDAILLLPRRLVEMGVSWRYRRNKGYPYADRAAEYEINLTRQSNDKRGIQKIDMGGSGRIRSPRDIPVPDYIPPA
jgi:hypothetical protein